MDADRAVAQRLETLECSEGYVEAAAVAATRFEMHAMRTELLALSQDEADRFGPLDFRRELLRMARSFQKVTHDAIAPLCQERGITVQQMHVLLELDQEPGQTASSLSERAGILRTNFAMVCRKLEERGLLERRRSDADRRSFELKVTDEGRAILRSIDEDIDRRYGDFFDAEPCETFDAIVLGFRTLKDMIERVGR